MSTAGYEPRHIVNGSLLRQFIGKNVSIFVKVEDCSGVMMKAKTTDGHNIRINLSEPISVPSSNEWIEIIGKPAGPDTIRSKEVITFERGEQEFDSDSHNILVQLLNNCTDLFHYEN